MKKMIRVLCADDHPFLVEGLRTRFELEGDIECVGRLPSAEGLAAEAERLRPDAVLMDIEMPGPDPFDAADEIRRRTPDVRVILLSGYVRDRYISAALRCKVWGYFSKSDDPQVIIQGIRDVARGQFAMSPLVSERCRGADKSRGLAAKVSCRLDTLTKRELEVLRFIGRGLTRIEIAETICRSPKTVDGHRERIMQKLDIHTGPELVRFAIREGLVGV